MTATLSVGGEQRASVLYIREMAALIEKAAGRPDILIKVFGVLVQPVFATTELVLGAEVAFMIKPGVCCGDACPDAACLCTVVALNPSAEKPVQVQALADSEFREEATLGQIFRIVERQPEGEAVSLEDAK